jgi:cyclic beta-1,2-glucan synthetase
LRQDPAGVYAAMDFATRDHYRHVVEKLAKRSDLSEADVTHAAIELAQGGVLHDPRTEVETHVGFYLVDKGLPVLEQRIVARPTTVDAWQRLIKRAPLTIYLGSIVLLTALFSWPLLVALQGSGISIGWRLVIALLIALAASQLAIGLVNWLMTLVVKPTTLARMDYSNGLPSQACTLVVIPTLFSRPQDVEDLVQGLEVRFLANRDQHLYFALLTDFTDASTEVVDQDAPLLQLAQERIDVLNQTYADAQTDRFFLLHRPRRWNPVDKVWMPMSTRFFVVGELIDSR